MSQKTTSIIALVCSLWFLLLGWMWVYFFNVIFAFPIAILGVVLWRSGKATSATLIHKITGIIFLIGSLACVGSLLLYR
jgi:hypothetical protein